MRALILIVTGILLLSCESEQAKIERIKADSLQMEQAVQLAQERIEAKKAAREKFISDSLKTAKALEKDHFLSMPKRKSQVLLAEYFHASKSDLEKVFGAPVKSNRDKSDKEETHTYKNIVGLYEVTFINSRAHKIIYRPSVFIKWDTWDFFKIPPVVSFEIPGYSGILTGQNTEEGIKDGTKYYVIKMINENYVVIYTEKHGGVGSVTIQNIIE